MKDENAKDLFENGEWSKNDITMERVGKNIKVFPFVKDGTNRGERHEEFSTVGAGQTFRVTLKDFMFESKKVDDQNVFPQDIEEIPAFSVVEVMITPSNTKCCSEGYGFNMGRLRLCPFSLYSMDTPLGLGLIPSDYDSGVRFSEECREASPALGKILDTKNIGFSGKIRQGSYLVEYKEDICLLYTSTLPTIYPV